LILSFLIVFSHFGQYTCPEAPRENKTLACPREGNLKIGATGISVPMKLAALYSGGKDSTYALQIMEQQGHEVDPLVSIVPTDPHSWLFHTPNLHLMPLLAEALGKSLVTVSSPGTEAGDLQALRGALGGLDVEGVITGAIASDYQWDRINGVCEDLGLRVFSPLWRKEQSMLMDDLISSGIRPAIVAIQAEGLGPEWLGQVLDEGALKRLAQLAATKGINLSGEGGEYETLTLDSPFHLRRLEIMAAETRLGRDGGRLNVTEARLGGPKG
jgi:diphthine-ammonia ligase